MDRVIARVVVCGAILCSLAGVARPARAQTQPAADEEVKEVRPHRLVLTIIDKETRQPLTGVKVRYLGDDGPHRFGGRGETDTAGVYTFALPTNKLAYFGYAIRMTGYIPMAMRWWNGVVPATYTLEMERGKTIGGTVVDDAGQPVVGAKVTLRVGRDTGHPNAIFDTDGDFVTTGKGGVWTYDRAPDEFTTAQASAADGRFVSGPAASLSNIKADDALAKTLVLKLERGLTFYGTVVDEQHHPLQGVVVRVASATQNDLANSSCKSDSSGNLKATIVPKQGQHLVLTSEGYAPDQIEPAAVQGDATDPTEIVLRTGQTLRVKITDPAGKSIPRAWIIITSWRGIAYREQLQADAAGKVEWPSAPVDEVQVDVVCQGYQRQGGVSLKASKDVQTITLTPMTP
jgi:hypothetical protein